jgi:hypothetical protein
MNVYRLIIESDDETHLVDAGHENGLLQSIKVYPVEEGKVQDALLYEIGDLPDLSVRIQENLTVMLEDGMC